MFSRTEKMATKRHKIHKISFLSLLCLFVAIPCIAAYGQASRTLIDQYCIGCHNERLKTAGLMLDKLDLAQIGSNPAVWEKVARKVRSGDMPPAGLPRLPKRMPTLLRLRWKQPSIMLPRRSPIPGPRPFIV